MSHRLTRNGRRGLVGCALVLAALLAGAGAAVAQGRVPPADTTVARPADSTRTRSVNLIADLLRVGGAARELVGNVRLRQDGTRLWADQAVEYPARDEILFTGRVLIVEEEDSLWADRLLYHRTRKTAFATGNVRLSDGEVVALAPTGRYFTREKRARFEDGVTLIDSASVLTSRGGEYFSDEKRAEFFGDVHLQADRTYLEADSVTYYRETEVSLARGHVFIERIGDDEAAEADTLTRTFLFGQWAYTDNRADSSRVQGRPLLLQIRTDTTGADPDTLLIRAARLTSVRMPEGQRLVAVDSVRVWRRAFAAVADSLYYRRHTGDTLREESRLFGNPMAWFEQTQISGDTLRVTARGGAVDSLFARGSGFVAQRDSLLERFSQMKGRYLAGHFVRDSLRTLEVQPQAEAIYYLRDRATDAPDGAVQTSADRIVFHLRGDRLERLRILRGVEGTYYEEALLPATLQLDGFFWRPERRPTHDGLLRPPALLDPLRRRYAD